MSPCSTFTSARNFILSTALGIFPKQRILFILCTLAPGVLLIPPLQYYHLPIAEAASKLGVGETVFKKLCRDLAIPRWPSRKLQSIDKLHTSVLQVG